MNLNDIKITPLLDTLQLLKINDEEYFSKKYSGYISNSRLGLLNPKQDGSSELFFKGFKPIYSSSLDVGSAVHCMCLQKGMFNIVDSVNKPTGKMGVMAEKLFDIWKGHIPTSEDILKVAKEIDYYKGKLTPTRIEEVKEKCKDFWIAKKRYLQTRRETLVTDLFLDQKSRQTAYACIQAVENNTSIQKILNPTSEIEGLENPISETEWAILLNVKVEMPEIPPFILKLKAKLDHFVINKACNEIQVNDLKTLGKILSEFKSNVNKYCYNRELAMYTYLLKLVAEKFYGMENPTVRGNYLVVSTIPQYYSKVVPLTKKDFTEGFKEFSNLLKLAAFYAGTKYKDFAEWI